MDVVTIKKNSVGLALGGGGIKGLAHIGLLKQLDEINMTPKHISGTSMGAIIGALYALGLSGIDIEQRVREHVFVKGEPLKKLYQRRDQLLKWTKVFSLSKARGGLFVADGLFKHLFDELIDLNFEDLPIPFTASTTDFHTGQEVAINSGPLLPAVLASMAVPGVFAPVKKDQRLLVDGGLVNNVPTNHIQHCDYKIASDVIALPTLENPKTLEIINGGVNIMLCHSVQRSLLAYPLDVLVKPNTHDIDAFEFSKINEALIRGDKAVTSTITKALRAFNI